MIEALVVATIRSWMTLIETGPSAGWLAWCSGCEEALCVRGFSVGATSFYKCRIRVCTREIFRTVPIQHCHPIYANWEYIEIKMVIPFFWLHL